VVSLSRGWHFLYVGLRCVRCCLQVLIHCIAIRAALVAQLYCSGRWVCWVYDVLLNDVLSSPPAHAVMPCFVLLHGTAFLALCTLWGHHKCGEGKTGKQKHRRRLRGCLWARAPVVKLIWVLRSRRNPPPFCNFMIIISWTCPKSFSSKALFQPQMRQMSFGGRALSKLYGSAAVACKIARLDRPAF